MRLVIRPLIILCLLFSVFVEAQVNRYAIYFGGKSGTPFDISRPTEFLSNASIQRRIKRKAPLGKSDLPVNPTFIQAVKDLGIKVLYSSKWLNCVIIEAQESQLTAVSSLAFVEKNEYLGPGPVPTSNSAKSDDQLDQLPWSDAQSRQQIQSQLSMIGIDQMHAEGYQGENITIAVMDSGFPGVNSAASFSGIFVNQVKDSYNFAYQKKDVFGLDSHGTSVLSIITGNQSDFKGSAPKANYLLYITEFVPSEYRIEEYNWVLAAERADSAGVDIINTSLGYTTFDDASMNYKYADMNGGTSVISKAAQIAAEAGILVVVSAGNEGNGTWQFISAPGDAKDVLTAGAVDNSFLRASFSSKGPTSDGRIKPDLVALGVSTTLLNASGNITTGSGTSFSAPILTGFAAGVLQQFPELTIPEILEKLRSSGSQYNQPDGLLGYGLPDYFRLKGELVTTINTETELKIFPNPVSDGILKIQLNETSIDNFFPTFWNTQGRILNPVIIKDENKNCLLVDVGNWPTGIYLLKSQLQSYKFVVK